MKNQVIVLALIGFSLSGAARTQEPPAEILRKVSDALPPAVGNRAEMKRLLTPAVKHPQLSEAFKLAGAQRVVGETLVLDKNCKVASSAAIAPPPCLYRTAAGSVFRAGLREGRLDYINPARHVDWLRKVPNGVKQDVAQATVLRLAGDLAIPPAEILASRIKRNDLFVGSGKAGGAEPFVKLRAEVHVHLPRQVDGTRVLGSSFRGVIDAKGQLARFHAVWPDFVLRAGLADSQTLPREEVARRIALRLAEQFNDEDLDQISIAVAYVPVDRLNRRDTPDSEGSVLVRTERTLFEPALVIHALPPETGEDSGKIDPPVIEIVEPLLEAPAKSNG